MNAQKLCITALLSVATLASCQSNDNPNKDNTPMPLADSTTATNPEDSLLTSIPVDSANKMINSYLTSIGGTAGQDELFSLIVDAGSMRNYLSNRSIKKVKLMFAHTLDYINAGHGGQNAGYGSGKLTLVIAGYDADGNYVLDRNNGVEDNLFPCPTNCPSTGSASSNTIPPQQ